MTAVWFFLGGAAALALLAITLGKMIKVGNEIDEHALPFESPAESHPYTNRSTLLALPRSGRFYDSEH